MALDAGVMTVTVQFGQNLKDKDWFGKQDPYCVVKVGGQMFRTRTATDGGKNPVWNETFRFNILNENDAELQIKDSDVSRDDTIGTARCSFARARESGRDSQQVPVMSKSGKQHGFVQVQLEFAKNSSLKPGGAPQAAPAPYGYPPQYGAQYAYPGQIPGYGAPYGAPPPAYGAPPPAYGAPPPAYGAPAPGYGAPPPQYGAPPPAYGAPAPAYGAPPAPAPGAPAYPPPGGAGYPTAPYGQYPPPYGAPQPGAPAPYGAPPPGAYPGYPPR